MVTSKLNKDFSSLNTKPYLDVYLRQSSLYQDFFHHPGVQEKCFKVFSKYSKCYLLSVYLNSKLIGFAGFRTQKLTFRKIDYTFLVPVSYNVSEYNYPVVESSHIELFMTELAHKMNNYNLYFPYVPGYFKEYILRNLKKSFVSKITESPIIRSKDSIIDASRKKNPAKRKRQLIKKHLNVKVEHLVKDIDKELLEVFYNMHVKRWEKQGVNSHFCFDEYREIFTILINSKIEKNGFPILSYLKADDEFLAFQLGYLYNDTYLAQTIARTTDEKYTSVGSILNKEVLEFCSQKGIGIFDTGLGQELYKFSYVNEVRSYYCISFFKNGFNRIINRISLR